MFSYQSNLFSDKRCPCQSHGVSVIALAPNMAMTLKSEKQVLGQQGSSVRPNFSMVRLKKKTKSPTQKVSLWFTNRHTLGV